MSACVRVGSIRREPLPENASAKQAPKFSLPPNVNGRRRGSLTIRLSAVRWTSKAFPAVQLSLQWWGQRGEGTLRWEEGKLSRAATSGGLEYHILTSEELFRKYLKAAEPLQGRLVSARTNSLIGTVQIPVPGKLVNFRPGNPQELTVSGVGEIFSGRRFGLGEVELEFALKFDEVAVLEEKENRKDSKMVVAVKKPVPSLPVVVQPERDLGMLAVEGVPVPLHETKQLKQPKTFRSLDSHSRSKVLSYLSGRLSSSDEDDTLHDICSISPAESMMEALHKFDAAPLRTKSDYLRVVDSVRFHVETLKFTKAGLKEVFHKAKLASLADVGFLVKVKAASQNLKVRIGSESVSECGEVRFDGKGMAKVTIPKKVEEVQFEFLVYLAMGPVFHQRSTVGRLIFLGSSVVKLEELVGNRFSCHKKCPVRLVSDDILLGMLTVKLELGARGLHFGPELIDALQVDKENVSIRSSSSSESGELPVSRCWAYNPPTRHHFHCRPMTCSQDERSSGDGNKPVVQQASSQGTSGSAPAPTEQNPAPGEGSESKPRPMDTQERPKSPPKNALHGVLHLGQLKEAPELESGGYFLVAHGFWSTDGEEPILTTELSQNGSSFNYLITFPVLPDERFLERTRNQHMLVELWQKAAGTAEKLVGVTRLPLHQFYIAFRDTQLAEHLARAKLPVVSIDGWSGIGSPLAAEPCGQVQAVLAVGTENQVEYFKLSRGLGQHHSRDAPISGRRPAVPEAQKSTSGTQTNFRPSSGSDSSSYQPINTTPSTAGKQQSEVANMLSAFIENLAQRLPISSERSTAPCYDQNFAESRTPTVVTPSLPSPHSQANKPEMRKTSDLLENLQRALAQKPAAGFTSGLLTAPSASPSEERAPEPLPETPADPKPTPKEKLFSVTIEIEQAVNLPKLNVSKKYGKRNKNKSGSGGQQQRIELEPSAYVTFEGYNLTPGTPNTVKSHEGIVYTTAVVDSSCNPAWGKKFTVQLPVDLMTNDEKRFILKVWRKAVSAGGGAAQNQRNQQQQPAPMEDAVVGFTAVDLSVLLNGMPCIMGWYNIMDFSGRCNGQIKVNIQPQENVTIYKDDAGAANFQIPLSIDVDIDATGNTSLSRALKRKFTELEEISQRLKARLFDVTGSGSDGDQDDEFERDLNTEADEGEDGEWPVDTCEDTSSGQKRNSQHPNGEPAMTLTTNTSSYSYTMSSDRRVPERSLTGCSNRSSKPQQSTTSTSPGDDAQLQLEELLKKHDLDTLINPKLLKSLINPSVMSTSESTPSPSRGNPYENLLQEETGSGAGTSADDADMSEDSPRTVTSDKVKLISSALQRTTISDDNPTTVVTTTTTTGEGGSSGKDQQKREAPEGEPMTVNDK